MKRIVDETMRPRVSVVQSAPWIEIEKWAWVVLPCYMIALCVLFASFIVG
jgi:hypothetical protein